MQAELTGIITMSWASCPTGQGFPSSLGSLDMKAGIEMTENKGGNHRARKGLAVSRFTVYEKKIKSN